ncbi:hypothetical protein ASC95_20180 [Pelomonas sp. Root1217]|uniref:DUF1345 domain-containing protein n=1 Tax=Pelomonas sp. Root1217 TaxID=1736430 RepID=UPI00071405B0|nr:DUF1345 domain-containing protein [Pelomonas sp. Root1217]KQV48269.1 hypothetical protein ASC95_20180 [Pelomonas sp. Root1217]
MNLWTQLRLRPRLLSAILAGSALAALWPGAVPMTTRLLLGWDFTLWIYLPLALWMMLGRAGSVNVQQRASQLTEGLPVMLLLAVGGALASFGAIALELGSAKQAHTANGLTLAFAIATVCSSWLLLPVEFGIAYASLYHGGGKASHGLEFPGDDEGPPDYGDFLYFSITVAATSQTSDVCVSSRAMRRLVLVQGLLAFVFNTGVLALTVNILAGLIS